MRDELVGYGEDGDLPTLLGMMLAEVCLHRFAEATQLYPVLYRDNLLESFGGENSTDRLFINHFL